MVILHREIRVAVLLSYSFSTALHRLLGVMRRDVCHGLNEINNVQQRVAGQCFCHLHCSVWKDFM